MMNVTAAAANAPAMAALQENGVRPASDAAGTTTTRSIIVVSVIRYLLRARFLIGAARVASDSPHTLNSRPGFEFRRVSDIGLLFDAKANGAATPSVRTGTRQPWSQQPMRRALRAAA